MFEHKHYVPLLKAKEGEFKALGVTSNSSKKLMTPLLEVVKIDWDYRLGIEKKSLESHLEKVGKSIVKHWGIQSRIFVDSPLLDADRKMTGGTHYFDWLFDDFRKHSINAIPVTGLKRHLEYKTAVKTINDKDKKGICLRLKNAVFTDLNLKKSIDDDLNFYSIKPQDVDLVIDLRSVDSNTAKLLPITIAFIINSKLPHITRWRSLTVAASSFPLNLSFMRPNTVNTVERSEWLLWRSLFGAGLRRMPAYGDYAISHPEILEMDPIMMTMSANIRYTHDDYWLLLKGRATKTHGYSQYYNLSSDLVARPEYSGSLFSWGDDYIQSCSLRTTTTGNTTTWRQIGCNHHFEKVVSQISILP